MVLIPTHITGSGSFPVFGSNISMRRVSGELGERLRRKVVVLRVSRRSRGPRWWILVGGVKGDVVANRGRRVWSSVGVKFGVEAVVVRGTVRLVRSGGDKIVLNYFLEFGITHTL